METTSYLPTLLDAVLSRFPGWAFPLMLLLAFLLAVVLAGYGVRALIGLAGRATGRRASA